MSSIKKFSVSQKSHLNKTFCMPQALNQEAIAASEQYFAGVAENYLKEGTLRKQML